MAGGKRVLVVDDEQDIRDSLAEVIPMIVDGAQVHTADDGHAAWQLIQEDPGFDLIISDQRMPRMTGLELIDRIRGLDHHIPCILYTAFDTDLMQMRHDLSALVAEVLPKAADFTAVSTAIQRHLGVTAT